jgi:DNA (cytosine-5)-methyltransferase 1
MTRPKLLDLFCGAGGAAMGYHRAGFDVTGVDIAPQPRYPFRFVQADAMTYPLDGFDAIHASPPCRDHTRLTQMHGTVGSGWMLPAIRDRLTANGQPWILENVPGAPMRADFLLCGCMFGLPALRRDRWFETSWRGFNLRSPCHHIGYAVSVSGHPGGFSNRDGIPGGDTMTWRRAMGIDWMTAAELAQAIPPAYTEYIGGQLLREFPAQEPAGRGSVGG